MAMGGLSYRLRKTVVGWDDPGPDCAVTATDVIETRLAPSGGCAVRLEPRV